MRRVDYEYITPMNRFEYTVSGTRGAGRRSTGT